jgi:hypothetical protein
MRPGRLKQLDDGTVVKEVNWNKTGYCYPVKTQKCPCCRKKVDSTKGICVVLDDIRETAVMFHGKCFREAEERNRCNSHYDN